MIEPLSRRQRASFMFKRAWASKGAEAGMEVGWQNPLWGVNRSSALAATFGGIGTERRLHNLMNTYGGTDEAVVWVFACTSLIASTGASYEWSLVKPNARREVVASPPKDVADLLAQPNRDTTYFDFAEDVFTDLELVGNSYWLKDQQNGLGQPLELLRMNPAGMKVVIDSQGRRMGYVYEVQSRTDGPRYIPYKLDEIIHYRTRNPLSPYYGMGTVEALLREIEAELSQTMHVTAFFNNGARISGILSSADPMSDSQFNRIVQQFNDEYAGAQNAYKMLIADGNTKFEPVSQPPAQAGVVELRKLQKDAILSGFGVPEFLLGGAAQAGVYKMEEAQNVFFRSMMPRARRVEERTSIDLTALWNLGFDILAGATEPRSIRVARAKEMVGTGATLNQILREQDLATIDRPEGDIPLLPGGLIPWYQAAGLEPPKLAVATQTGGAVDQGLPNAAAVEGDPSGGPASAGQPRNAPASTLSLPPGVTEKKLVVPKLPTGFERLSEVAAKSADNEDAQSLLDGQASFFEEALPTWRSAIVSFFSEQRSLVFDNLSSFGLRGVRNPSRAKYAGTPVRSKKELTPAEAWVNSVQDPLLQRAFLDLIDRWGPLALEVGNRITGSGLTWNPSNDEIKAARDRLAQMVQHVNETTQKAIAEQIEVGLRRNYSILQIANGFAQEDYLGIQGVFDQAIGSRAEMIAQTELAKLFNGATLASYTDMGLTDVEVFDGMEFDEGCREANGSVWTLEQAKAQPIEHPRCVRCFVPIKEGS